MKTAGQILKETRLQKKISLEEVEAEIKVRKQYLLALEKDEYQKLPSLTSTLGFIKNYAEFLGLSPAAVLATFRRDFSPVKKKKMEKLPNYFQGENRQGEKLLILAVVFSFLIFASYLGYQYLSLVGKPSLRIFSPEDQKQVEEEIIEVVGKTHPDASVTINDKLVPLSLNGEFRYQVELFPGENKLIIKAKNKRGKETTVERTIFLIDK